MRLTFLLALVTLFCATSFAAGPFGDVTTKSFKTGRDQSSCTAERLLENAIRDTGIDAVSGSVQKVWSCERGAGSRTARERRCPYDQYMKDASYKCYSNNSKGYPYLCVSGARSASVLEKYADSEEKENIPRARFSQMFVFQGDGKTRNIKMDANGCEATEVSDDDATGYFNNGGVRSDKDTCVKLLNAALSGGELYPASGGRPAVKFCETDKSKDDRYVSAYLTRAKDLYHCYAAFPNLPDLLKAGESVEGSAGKASR